MGLMGGYIFIYFIVGFGFWLEWVEVRLDCGVIMLRLCVIRILFSVVFDCSDLSFRHLLLSRGS
jgi:hypothetical protein